MANFYGIDGTFKQIKNPTLEQLQKVVGGYIEASPITKNLWLVVQDDGANRLPLNLFIMEHISSEMGIPLAHPIYGNALICTFEELN